MARMPRPLQVFSTSGTITLAPGQRDTLVVSVTNDAGPKTQADLAGNLTVRLISGSTMIIALNNVSVSPSTLAVAPTTKPSDN